MKITLVRHGQTEMNYNGLMQGISNQLLNDTGRRQCQRLRNELKDHHFDVCYMSPLVRCVETAMILVGDRVEIIPDKRLIERDIGEFEGKEKKEYNHIKYWDYSLNSSDNGVESVKDMFERCKSFLDYILKKHEGKDIIIVTHSAIFKCLYYLLTNADLTKKLGYMKVDNCFYKTFDYNQKK